MQHTQTIPKPTLAMVIAFCDGTPVEKPTPYVIAQRAHESRKLELWNTEVPDGISNIDVFDIFAREYLHEPSVDARCSFIPLEPMETESYHLRIFVSNHLFGYLHFKDLGSDKVVPVPLHKLENYEDAWNSLTRQAIDYAFKSEGMKIILGMTSMIRSGWITSRDKRHEHRAL